MFGKFFSGTAGVMVAVLLFGTIVPLFLCGGCLMMAASGPAVKAAREAARKVQAEHEAKELEKSEPAN